MPETTGSEYQPETEPRAEGSVINELANALRYIGDVSYAILPKEIAHNLGDLKKSFLNTVRSLVDKDIEWVEARVEGGDRLRQEWREKCDREKSEGAPDPIN